MYQAMIESSAKQRHRRQARSMSVFQTAKKEHELRYIVPRGQRQEVTRTSINILSKDTSSIHSSRFLPITLEDKIASEYFFSPNRTPEDRYLISRSDEGGRSQGSGVSRRASVAELPTVIPKIPPSTVRHFRQPVCSTRS